MKNYCTYIDHTLLKADAVKEDIEKLCKEAREHHFASVCVNGYWVPYCHELLQDSDVKVCTVVGFPLGACATNVKAFEAKTAVRDGAEEIDMVLAIGELKAGNKKEVLSDILAVRKACEQVCLKVILECCLLSQEEIETACRLCVEAGADYVKTSTGFSSYGAKVEDVVLMRKTVGTSCKVKAAGGIRTKEDMLKMIEAGADRIGTSAGTTLVQ